MEQNRCIELLGQCERHLHVVLTFLAGRRFLTFGDNVYLVPEETPELTKIRVLRPGLQAGTLKTGRMEPAHALALFLKKEDVFQWAELGTGETAAMFLRGDAIGAGELEAVS